jgi:hypothetical protein
MKVTRAQLKQIIKEELDNVLAEENSLKLSDSDVEAGEKMQDTPIGNVIFKALDKDPKVQKALEAAMKAASKQLSEENDPSFGNVGGQYATLGGLAGAATQSTPAAMAVFGGLLSKSAVPAIVGVLKGMGLVSLGMGGGALAGYLIYKLGKEAVDAISNR